MPTLFVVVDEFSEMLSQKLNFGELLVAIGRLRRSLQEQLLLASQRLEEGWLRGRDSHLSYRIGPKTFSAAHSRAVLGVPDAAKLPPVPESGYPKVESSSMVRFKAGLRLRAVPGSRPGRAAGVPAAARDAPAAVLDPLGGAGRAHGPGRPARQGGERGRARGGSPTVIGPHGGPPDGAEKHGQRKPMTQDYQVLLGAVAEAIRYLAIGG
ncbi:hypothetical protein GCM10023200_19800 [Actinomycetospora chlora]|uniref:FtsK domain-containing protein n=1 Tax=Actinomycetospora chlora TaxID=663608 RepID=A0ABP9AT69_9PSEU